MKLWLIRHTLADIPDGICYGRSDVALPASFDDDAQPLLAAIHEETSNDADEEAGDAVEAANMQVYSSPLQRCARLAQRIASPAVPVFDTRLQEMDFGAWELKPWAVVDRAALDAWAADPLDWRMPGGETARELAGRACAFLQELKAARVPAARLVTHGGVLRMLCAYLWEQPLERVLNMAIPFGSGLRVHWADGARLLSAHGWNDRALPEWIRR